MSPDNFKTKEPMTLAEVLTYYHNMFSDKVVANLIDAKHYEYVKEINPEYKMPTQNGVLTVDELLENARNGARYARENLARIQHFMTVEKEGNFDSLVTDAELGRATVPAEAMDTK